MGSCHYLTEILSGEYLLLWFLSRPSYFCHDLSPLTAQSARRPAENTLDWSSAGWISVQSQLHGKANQLRQECSRVQRNKRRLSRGCKQMTWACYVSFSSLDRISHMYGRVLHTLTVFPAGRKWPRRHMQEIKQLKLPESKSVWGMWEHVGCCPLLRMSASTASPYNGALC